MLTSRLLSLCAVETVGVTGLSFMNARGGQTSADESFMSLTHMSKFRYQLSALGPFQLLSALIPPLQKQTITLLDKPYLLFSFWHLPLFDWIQTKHSCNSGSTSEMQLFFLSFEGLQCRMMPFLSTNRRGGRVKFQRTVLVSYFHHNNNKILARQ